MKLNCCLKSKIYIVISLDFLPEVGSYIIVGHRPYSIWRCFENIYVLSVNQVGPRILTTQIPVLVDSGTFLLLGRPVYVALGRYFLEDNPAMNKASSYTFLEAKSQSTPRQLPTLI